MRPDIRIRIRGGVIRIRIHKAGISAIIRITAKVNTLTSYNLLLSHSKKLRPLRGRTLNVLRLDKAEARPDSHIRSRGGVIRIRRHKAGISAIRRSTAKENTP